jgi:hypothetical protein
MYKKMLSTVAIAMLAVSMLMAIPMVKASPDWIAVDPVSYTGSSIGETFTVDINVSATGLAGFEYKFKWNNTLLDVIGIVITPPWGGYFIGVNTTSDLGDGRDQHFLGVASLPTTGFTGDATLCTYTFQVIYEPYFPEGDGYSLLDLQDTKFSDTGGNPVAHDTYDGEYHIAAGVPDLPTVFVDPASVNPAPHTFLSLGDTFTVDVEIRELATAWDLAGWEFWLRYNTTLLDVLSVTIGGFLGGFAGPNGTFGITKYGSDWYPPNPLDTFESEGEVAAVEVLLGTHTVPFGAGVLATIEFNVTYESVGEFPPPCCDLDLYLVKLSDSGANPIGKYVEDGYYCAPYRAIGRGIDVYTEHERWPDRWTPCIGEGPGVKADAYSPQENVTVCALVTYADDPVCNKLVAFEITGPECNNETITFTRTAYTDNNGEACITFRIPWPCENGDCLIMGEWCVLAIVSIAEMSVNDTVCFDVGWIFEILEVELVDNLGAAQTSVNKGSYAYFNVTIKHLSMCISRFAVLTVVVYDDLGVPVGYATLSSWFPATPDWEIKNFAIYIPLWAYKGIGTAYANVYTDMPSMGGVPYGPEAEGTFSIASA